MLCLLPLLYSYLAEPQPGSPSSKPRAVRLMDSVKRRLSPRPGGAPQYLPVPHDDEPAAPQASAITFASGRVDGESDDGRAAEDENRRFGWRKWALFWLPAICDMSGTTVSSSFHSPT